ncbi:flavin-containing monooxygenase [Jidongwangia harbinensis]|uniref:flavin-containing monooxygenase n=1 Tax=Jidongwangia harbinensis TaxID=2878561 RepID=UPI001CDA4AE5|nr:NAD(P)/FAD-dependent oxidoreductase [Jidongwangia harbinensis]MCA2214283.1 NAD(P)/FAD-dependent oxidoreductase [Jidongwangia harbinensis]
MTEHVDVLIIGAGLSGVGAAWRLRQHRPGTSYLILEARESVGGTWDLFRYPGVRSDSDMFTLSYPFRPWRGERSMATGDTILDYIRDTADAGGITGRIRLRTRVLSAAWSSGPARWTVRTTAGTYTCGFLHVCAGYYDYERGHQPEFPGRADYAGRFVHPQFWPGDLDHAGRRVVVIGSGSTAVTLVPALAERAGHVTMLQRSPSYVTPRDPRDAVADRLRRWLPAGAAHRLARARNILVTQGFYELSRRRPEPVKRALRRRALRVLPDPAYLDAHFTPSYQPWDQRPCFVPSGDLFRAIRSGAASVVTDRIDRFVPEGIRLASGPVLPADIVVSATGLTLLPVGGIRLTVDGEPVDPGGRVAYRGMMFSGVPNLSYCLGYANASWTLRADLSSRYLCRLLAHLDRHGYTTATPNEPPPGPRRPLLDLTSGYVQRARDRFPQRGSHQPWTVRQNYLVDLVTTMRADVTRDMTFR